MEFRRIAEEPTPYDITAPVLTTKAQNALRVGPVATRTGMVLAEIIAGKKRPDYDNGFTWEVWAILMETHSTGGKTFTDEITIHTSTNDDGKTLLSGNPDSAEYHVRAMIRKMVGTVAPFPGEPLNIGATGEEPVMPPKDMSNRIICTFVQGAFADMRKLLPELLEGRA